MIGKTLGHYQIIEKPGEGGGGMAYRGDDITLCNGLPGMDLTEIGCGRLVLDRAWKKG